MGDDQFMQKGNNPASILSDWAVLLTIQKGSGHDQK